MDSITHALYKAILADDKHQHSTKEAEADRGLQPLAKRESVHNAFAGAEGSDLHIALTKGDETLALFMEFVAAGFTPPVSLIHQADVILSPGYIEIIASTDKGDATWTASLQQRHKTSILLKDGGPPRAVWIECIS